MFFGRGTVAMVGNDSGEVKCQCSRRALRYLRWGGVEDVRRKVCNTAIARKQVGGEHESEALAIEAHVSVGVAGKMDCAQTLPYVEEVAVVEPAVGNERMEGENGPTDALQATCDSCPAAIARMTGVVVGIETRGGNPSAALACDGRHVEDVVEMSVGDDNAPNGIALPTASPECALQKESPADKSGIEQIQPGCVTKDVEVERWRSDLENIGMQRRVTMGLTISSPMAAQSVRSNY